jgi:Chaperone of endosialidase
MGQLVFQATAGGQVALVGPNPTTSFALNVPAVNGNLVTTGDTGTVTNTMLASSAYTAPGTIGSGTANTGAFTALNVSTSITNASLTSGRVIYTTTGGLETTSANLTFNGTTLTTANDASISGLTVGRGGGNIQYNTAFGVNAGAANTTGTFTAVGTNSLATNTTGNANTAVGGYDSVSGIQGALQLNTTGSYNIAVGTGALKSNTTANNSVAVGYQAGYSSNGNAQTFIGYQAGYSNVTGTANTFIGYYAGKPSTGSYNTATGWDSYGANGSPTGNGNSCYGTQSGYNITTGSRNTFVGGSDGSTNYAAGYFVTTGNSNTIIGSYSGNQGGLDIRTASNYIVLSDGDGNPRGVFTPSGQLVVGGTAISNIGGSGLTIEAFSSGAGAIGGYQTASGGYVYNSYAVSNGGSYYHMYFSDAGTSHGSISSNGTLTSYNTTSDYRLKENVTPIQNALNTVAQLNPVTYKWSNSELTGQGFIAHELQAIFPECVTGEKDAIDKDGNPVYQQMDSSYLIGVLTKAIQEQQAMIETLTTRLNALEGK